MRKIVFIPVACVLASAGLSHTSDEQYKKPIEAVLLRMEPRHVVDLLIPPEEVAGSWLTGSYWYSGPDISQPKKVTTVTVKKKHDKSVCVRRETFPDADSVLSRKIAVCDWMILKRQKAGAFRLAREIGADGVEIDMGGLGDRPTFDNKLWDPVTRREFLDESVRQGIEISSVAMSGFYAQSFPAREGIERMIDDCINTMLLMGVRIAFLPLGVEGDLVRYPERRQVIMERLKMAGQKAEAAGVIIGVETSLDAASEVQLLAEIGSPAIRIYFNFQNALEAGRDLCEELKILGCDRICQIHCTDTDGALLENNERLDMQQVKNTLDEMGWEGWLVIERSRNASAPHDVTGNFGANTRYLKSIFQ